MDRAKTNIHLSDKQKDIKIIDINGKNITKRKPSATKRLSLQKYFDIVICQKKN